MSKVSELMDMGVITQDPDREDRVVFNVPIYIKKEAVEAGGFELFAKAYGWTPTYLDGDGIEQPHPQAAHEACVAAIWNFVRQVFRETLRSAAIQQADQQADALIS